MSLELVAADEGNSRRIDHVLITGGAGFIGTHLAEALLEQGHRVSVIDDLSTGRMENIEFIRQRSRELAVEDRFRFAIGSITEEVVMDRLVSECDLIFHLAAAVGVKLIVRDPVHTIETNIQGTDSVLKMANRYRKKVLIASTSEVYGKSNKIPFSEDDDRLLGPTTRARWAYSDSKAIDEFLGFAYHRQMDLPVVIFRLFNTVGPRQRGRYGMVVPRFAKQALRGEKITVYGDGEQSRCFCDVRDVVCALTALSKNKEAEGEVFNIGSTEEITILDLARKVLELTGVVANEVDQRIEFVPYDEAYEKGFEDMRRRVPSIEKIGRLLDWKPTLALDATLQRVIEDQRTRAAEGR